VDTTAKRSGMSRQGQAMAEYAALVALVGVALVVILGVFGQATKHAWDRSSSNFADDPPAVAYGGAASAYSGGGGSSGGVRYTPPSMSSKDPAGPANKPGSSDSTSSGSGDSLAAQHASW
jgi:Flp pilus assembly pilin Flp